MSYDDKLQAAGDILEHKDANEVAPKLEKEPTRSNVCFNCSRPVPQVGPAETVIVAICHKCRPSYMECFQYCIQTGMNWREARLDVLQSILEAGSL